MDMLEFGKEVEDNVTAIRNSTFKSLLNIMHSSRLIKHECNKKQLFSNDRLFKICVHTRSGDFQEQELGPSEANQVGPAIDWILGHLPIFMVYQ
jgi:hypothetical protein